MRYIVLISAFILVSAGIVAGQTPMWKPLLPVKPFKLLPLSISPVKPVGALTPATPAPYSVYPVFRPTPDAYYKQYFGFFCKQEWILEKHTGMPLKLRVGRMTN
ncbi:hypothetical protein [Chitinophaga sp. 212800010-3]|uniref:hypothetical protein n=1 Tax=unclassified Chitinophaga TaxID=2619133 RepID=UPI002DE4CB0C|nr:hypothetical protein [Chitinophaga sp. 212800010-3]